MGRSVIIAKDGCVDFPLDNLLRKSRINQCQLAKITGINATYINRLCRKKVNPNWRTIMVIAAALNLDLGDLSDD